jgi:hypothetical protein
MMRRKNIWLDKNHFIRVCIFDKRREMLRLLERRYHENYNDYLAIFNLAWYFQGGIPRPYLGTISVNCEDQPVRKNIVHECVHAALWYLENTGTPLCFPSKYDTSRMSADDKKRDPEERLAMITSRLVTDVMDFFDEKEVLV